MYQHKRRRLFRLFSSLSSSSFSSISSSSFSFYRPPDPRTIGIVREAFGKWERRAPLAPSHVQALTQQGIKVLVQPSFRRVYPDEAYTSSGAIVQEDLSPASVILGVKQVPIAALLPNRTYLMFAHVLKGQPENMPLLDAIRSQKIRLVDFECITETGERGGARLVYFGRFAGVAGMVDILQGLGQNLLARGYNTPFLWSPLTYMYRDLEEAKEGVRRLGEAITREGLPRDVCPLVMAFTGRGQVSQGAQEVFELLPHEWVEVEDLPNLVASLQGEGGEEGGKAGTVAAQRKVYGVRVKEEDMVARVLAGEDDDTQNITTTTSSSSSPFLSRHSHPASAYNRAEYRSHPERYRPIFHERVAPYVSVLINCIYWDGKFPRLLSKAQVKALWGNEGGKEGGQGRLLAVADVSCDVEGSCEFLTRTTEIERPFFNYLPETGESLERIDGQGIVVGGVDILPAELPLEASLAFGDALMPLLPHLLQETGGEGGREGSLPPSLEGAVITTWEGELAEDFKYIDFLRVEHARAKQLFQRIHGPRRGEKPPPSLATSLLPSQQQEGEMELPHVTLTLRGHLFDSGLINQILDVVEARGGAFVIADCEVRPNKGKGHGMEKHFSTILLEVEASTEGELRDIVNRVQNLAELVESAEASITETSYESSSSIITSPTSCSSPTSHSSHSASLGQATVRSPRRVLVLGAGRVSGPAIDSLSQRHEVVVVGANTEEITRLGKRPKSSSNSSGSHREVVLDVRNENAALRKLMDKSDVVLSLLPAHMHPAIARDCLSLSKSLVTTSYISEDLRKMHQGASTQGLVFLNEVGLDPGMDHASAMRIIDQAKADGGKILAFRSVCGGLPSPDAAGKTPFLYKFSWSPRGVLTAAENTATFLEGGMVVRVEGEDLLRHAHPFPPQAFPTMRLEELPNRNALIYQEMYGIQEAETCFRGTLRYEGWSEIMYGCKVLGLLSHERVPAGCGSWREYMAHVLMGGEVKEGRNEEGVLEGEAWRRLRAAGVQDPARVMGALEWLGLGMGGGVSLPLPGSLSVIDAFSALLEEKLKYAPGEVDMVAMRHDITVAHGGKGGEEERHHYHTSTLLVYGNERDSAMAMTVGKTAAVATDLVLQGELQKKKVLGVLAPILPEIYLPILDRLAEEGLVFDDKCRVIV